LSAAIAVETTTAAASAGYGGGGVAGARRCRLAQGGERR
jgi:hypothetical protein